MESESPFDCSCVSRNVVVVVMKAQILFLHLLYKFANSLGNFHMN